jgi:hypothetical protein
MHGMHGSMEARKAVLQVQCMLTIDELGDALVVERRLHRVRAEHVVEPKECLIRHDLMGGFHGFHGRDNIKRRLWRLYRVELAHLRFLRDGVDAQNRLIQLFLRAERPNANGDFHARMVHGRERFASRGCRRINGSIPGTRAGIIKPPFFIESRGVNPPRAKCEQLRMTRSEMTAANEHPPV